MRLCEGGVEEAASVEGDEKMADLGRPLLTLLAGAEAGDDVEGFRAKGLLRRCAVPLTLKDMVGTNTNSC